MAGRVTRSAQFNEVELFRFPSLAALQAAKSIVLDATAYTYTEGVRNMVPAGTILKASPTRPGHHVTYDGTGTIDGVLLHYVDLAAQATQADEAGAMVWHGAIFATEAIIGFTQYSAALIAALPTCRFQ